MEIKQINPTYENELLLSLALNLKIQEELKKLRLPSASQILEELEHGN